MVKIKNNSFKFAKNKSYSTGQFEYLSVLSLTSETLQGSLEVLRNSFFTDDAAAVSCEVNTNPAAKAELEALGTYATKDGVSIVCVDKISGKVVAVAFNKLFIKDFSEDDVYLEKFMENCKEESSKSFVQFMIDADAVCDLFDYYNIDCLMEIMFLVTLPEFQKLGIALKLTEVSIDLAKHLLNGKNVKISLDGNQLPLNPVPKVLSAVFTSFITQKIGKKLNFNKTAEISYKNFIYKNHTFADKVHHTQFVTLESLKLI